MITKKELRKQQQSTLAAYFQTAQATTDSLNLYQHLAQLPEFKAANTIATTMSMAGELDTLPIIAMAQALGKQVAIPRTLPELQMQFYQVNGDLQLAKTQFGVVEPTAGKPLDKEQIDLIIVPGLAFTGGGLRVGFGAGFYDRFLADYAGNTVTLAVPPQYFNGAVWPAEAFDVKINQILTVH